MPRKTALAVTFGLLLAGVATVPASAATTVKIPAVAREVLPADDGWGAGTTGGSAAADDHVYVVRTRDELATALAATDTAPRIVLVAGTLRPDGDCASYADPEYSLEAFLAA